MEGLWWAADFRRLRLGLSVWRREGSGGAEIPVDGSFGPGPGITYRNAPLPWGEKKLFSIRSYSALLFIVFVLFCVCSPRLAIMASDASEMPRGGARARLQAPGPSSGCYQWR